MVPVTPTMGLLLTTVISAALEAVGRDSIRVLGYVWPLAGLSGPSCTCS